MSKLKDWRNFADDKAPLVIYYPACGGGEECITACPRGKEIWDVKPMKTTLFGFKKQVRYRPVMVRLDLCRRCYLCVRACPTGAIRINNGGKVFSNRFVEALRLLWNLIKLPFKKRYGLKFVLREEHIERFRRNNFPERYEGGWSQDLE